MDTMQGSAVERVLSAQVDGVTVDVTVAEDEEVPGLLVVFVDTTPRRAVRVIVNEVSLGVA